MRLWFAGVKEMPAALWCGALVVLFRISYAQQRPVPCTGLLCTPFSVSLCAASVPINGPLCTPPRKRRRQRNTWPLFELPHVRRRRQGNTSLFFSFLSSFILPFFLSFFLCVEASVPYRTLILLSFINSFCETLIFSFLFKLSTICSQCVIARSRQWTRRTGCSVRSLLVLVRSHHIQDASECCSTPGLTTKFHHYQRNEIIFP